MSDNKSLGTTVDELMAIIDSRRTADLEESYTAKLFQGELDQLLKKVGEEATEVVMAAKDVEHGSGGADSSQLCYEAVDLLYHLLVTCERLGVSAEDLSLEIRSRF